MEPTPEANWPQYMTIADVCDALGIVRSTFTLMRDKGDLPDTVETTLLPVNLRWRPHWHRAEILALLPAVAE